MIKERRYHLRTCPDCFVAQELVDWLTAHNEVQNRESAVKVMQHLMDHDVIHHVCDKWPMFKDAKLLYRFQKDDDTFPFSIEEVFMRGQSLYDNSLLQLREEGGVVYERSFPGYQLIDWLLKNGEVESHALALELYRALLEQGIIQHVSWKHHFLDSRLLYQFCYANLWPFWHSPSDEPSNDLKVIPSGSWSSVTQQLHHLGGISASPSLSSASGLTCNPKSVLKGVVTCEELLSPGAPYIKKVLTILGDCLGWGFVIRGRSPCYVQAVDPESPAAAAGVKVGIQTVTHTCTNTHTHKHAHTNTRGHIHICMCTDTHHMFLLYILVIIT
uniref:Si:dkeyp-97e7.9 n=1 Tax=Electrophorus electricus TaxID=8005 RepID=A0A4W4FEE5_ELEEL